MLKHTGYNCAVDLWSLGVITFMSLYGQAPFSDTPNSPKVTSSSNGQVGQVGQVGEAPIPVRSSSAVFSTALQRAPEAEDLLEISRDLLDSTREPPSEVRRRAIEERRRIGMLLSSDSDSEDPARSDEMLISCVSRNASLGRSDSEEPAARRLPTSDSEAAEVRQSEVRQSEVRQSEVRQSEVRQSEVRQREVRQSEVRQSEAGEAVLRSLRLESEVIFPQQEAGLRARTASQPIAVSPTCGTPSSNGLQSRSPAGLRNLEVRYCELLPADHGAPSSISPQISLGIPLHPLLKPSSPSVVLSTESPLIQRRMALLEHSSSGVFTYPERDDVSATARKFISQLLQVDPHCRLSALEALSHIWLQRRSRATSLDESFHPESFLPGSVAGGTPTPTNLSPTSRRTDTSESPERPQRPSSPAQMGGEGEGGGTAVQAPAESRARVSPLVSRCAAGTTARNLGSSPITPPDSREHDGEGDSADGDGTPPGVRLVSSRRPSGILPSSSEDEPEDDGVEERPGSFRRAGGGSRSSSQRMTRPPPIAGSRPGALVRPRSMTSEF